MRSIDELLATDQPAWPALHDELQATAVPIDILPADGDHGRDCLHRLQVTVRSRLGALAAHTGGLLAEHGWLRVLGGGCPSRALPDLATANALAGDGPPPALLIGYDVLGGRFEINGADPATLGRRGDPGEVCYFAPDTLVWEELGMGHGAWLSWIADGGTVDFYANLRWPDWAAETRHLPLDQGIAVYPFLWSQQAQDNLAATHREPTPIAELFDLQAATARQLATLPDGTTINIAVTD